ncbi:CerR family C-terminal domain-containing protein [Pseudomonas aeruginosa]|nr:CerR family C-terminal domain-containing protein [Pseudomonas aeruginosa]
MIVDRLYDEGGWHGRVFARELVAPSTHLAALVREGVMPRFKLMSDILSEVTGFSAQDPALLRCVLSVIAPMLMMLVVDRDTPTPFRALMTRPADELKSHLKHFALAGLLATKEQASRRGS